MLFARTGWPSSLVLVSWQEVNGRAMDGTSGFLIGGSLKEGWVCVDRDACFLRCPKFYRRVDVLFAAREGLLKHTRASFRTHWYAKRSFDCECRLSDVVVLRWFSEVRCGWVLVGGSERGRGGGSPLCMQLL